MFYAGNCQTSLPYFSGEWVEQGAGVWYNLFAENETLSLPVYEPIAIQFVLGGGNDLQFGGRGRVRGSSVVSHESPSQWA